MKPRSRRYPALAASLEQWTVEYSAVGPNSNSVTGNLLRSCGLPDEAATIAPEISTEIENPNPDDD